MKITERDILAVVHAEHSEAMYQRALRLLKRSRLQTWSVIRGVRISIGIGLALLAIISFLADESGLYGNEAKSASLIGTFFMPIVYLFIFLMLMHYEMLNRSALVVSRRWPGNPFNAAELLAILYNESPGAVESELKHRAIADFLERRLDIRRFRLKNLRKTVILMMMERKARKWTYTGLMLSALPLAVLPFLLNMRGESFVALPLACASLLGMLMLVGAMIYAGDRHTVLLRHLAMSVEEMLRCPECRYDLRGGHLVTINEQRQVRCPECGWTALVERHP